MFWRLVFFKKTDASVLLKVNDFHVSTPGFAGCAERRAPNAKRKEKLDRLPYFAAI
jgi:hypothetical protein